MCYLWRSINLSAVRAQDVRLVIKINVVFFLPPSQGNVWLRVSREWTSSLSQWRALQQNGEFSSSSITALSPDTPPSLSLLSSSHLLSLSLSLLIFSFPTHLFLLSLQLISLFCLCSLFVSAVFVSSSPAVLSSLTVFCLCSFCLHCLYLIFSRCLIFSHFFCFCSLCLYLIFSRCLCSSLQSIKDHMGEEKIKTFVNYCLGYMSTLEIPKKR